MGWFDDMFGGSQPAPQPNAPPAQPPADYNAFLASRIAAATAAEKAAPPTNLFAWLTGSARDAAAKAATDSAPAAWDALQQGHTTTQSGQLGLLTRLAQASAMAGKPIDPKDIMSAVPGIEQYGMSMMGAPGTPPSQPGAPQPTGPTIPSGPAVGALQGLMARNNAPGAPGLPAPDTTSAPPAGPPVNPAQADAALRFANSSIPSSAPPMPPATGAAPPGGLTPQQVALQRQTAYLSSMGRLLLMDPSTAQAGTDMLKQAQAGNPSGIVSLPDGTRSNVGNGAPMNMSTQDYDAQGAGKTSAAQAWGQVGAHNAETDHQGSVNVATHKANASTDAGLDMVTGFDKTNGQPVSTSRLDALQNPNFVSGTNPVFAGQQEELKELRTNAASADKGLDLAVNTANVAKTLYTGAGAGQLQDLRKAAIALGALTGAQPSQKVLDDASGFEQLKFNTQQLIAIEAHNFTARVTNNMVNLVNQAKPGDERTMQGIHDMIIKQLMPAMMREQDIGAKTAEYYAKNPTSRDAAWVVPRQLPLEKYSVATDLHNVAPGGFYIDPASGNIRQRPAQ